MPQPTPPPAPALPPPDALAPVAAAPEALVLSGGWQIEGLPATIRRAGPQAAERTVEFFTAQIRNPHTRAAVRHGRDAVLYLVRRTRARACTDFTDRGGHLHRRDARPVSRPHDRGAIRGSDNGIPEGKRNSVLTEFAGFLVNYPFSDIEVERILIELNRRHCSLPEKEVIGVARSILKKRRRGLHITYTRLAVKVGEGGEEGDTLRNALRAMNVVVRWNTRLNHMQFKQLHSSEDWQALEDGGPEQTQHRDQLHSSEDWITIEDGDGYLLRRAPNSSSLRPPRFRPRPCSLAPLSGVT